MSIKNYSVYSSDYGMLSINNILDQEFTKKTNKAVLTDYNTLLGVPEFFQKCKSRNIDPVIGLTVSIGDSEKIYGDITLYAKNEEGFNNLKKIVSTCEENKFKDKYTNFINVINHSKNLIAITGGYNSLLRNLIIDKDDASASKHIYNLQKIFGENLKLEIQSNSKNGEEIEVNEKIIDYSEKLNLNLFATNDQKIKTENHYHMLTEKIKIKRGINNKTNDTIFEKSFPNQTIRSSEAMMEAFNPYLSKLSNVNSIFQQVESYDIFRDEPEMPEFPDIGENHFMSVLKNKYTEYIKSIPEELVPTYNKRLKEEIELIEEFKFENYFTIFERIEKARTKDQRSNLRGSSISFLISNVMGFTDIDPVKFGLLSARFLNRNRLKRHELPDIDLESNDVDKVGKFLVESFGDKNVAYPSNFSQPKSLSQIDLAESALRADIESKPIDKFSQKRVFPEKEFTLLRKVVTSIYGHKAKRFGELFESGNYVPKHIAVKEFGLNPNTFSQEFKTEYYKISNMNNLCKNNSNVKQIVGFIKELDDVILSHGVNFGSVVISNSPMNETFSTQKVKESKDHPNRSVKLSIEATKEYVEKIGLIKLDILPNVYLDKLHNAYEQCDIDWNERNYNDKNVFDMLSKGENQTLNQIKSPSQIELAKRVNISNFEELTSFLALIRPAIGKENIELYIKNKNDPENTVYEHPILKEVLKETHGVLLFEEQIMELAQKAGGFTPEESDDFRALIKKVDENKKDSKYEKLQEMKKEFLTRAIEQNKLEPEMAKTILQKIDNLQGYAFSKAHSLSYTCMIYKQALVDYYYPAEYIQTHLNKSKGTGFSTEYNGYIGKLTRRGVNLLNVDINRSAFDFKTRSKGGEQYIDPSILSVTKDEKLSKIIVEERNNGGKFENIYDFVERTVDLFMERSAFSGEWLDEKAQNKEPQVYIDKVSTLIYAGAFDNLIPKEMKETLGFNSIRTVLLESLNSAVSLATNPFSTEDFVYKVPENALSLAEVIAKEDEIYTISPTKQRNQLRKNKQEEAKNDNTLQQHQKKTSNRRP